MLIFIFKRLIQTIPTLFAIIALTFFIIRLAPGGPFSSEKNIDPQIVAQLNAHYNLDKPLILQFFHYINTVLHGNLGPSFKYPNRTVNELIGNSFGVSLQLGMCAMLIALIVGVSAGSIAAVKRGQFLDHTSMSVAMIGICIPSFVLGPLLVLIFGLWLNWFNVAGWDSFADRILPSLTLAAPYAAYIARLTRSGMLDILPRDFIRTARAKGLGEPSILVKHALKGGVLPVVSFLGPAIAGIITGSFVIETIFQIPGLGRLFVMAAFNRDYTLIMGTVLLYAGIIIVCNMIVDILQIVLNPRLRF